MEEKKVSGILRLYRIKITQLEHKKDTVDWFKSKISKDILPLLDFLEPNPEVKDRIIRIKFSSTKNPALPIEISTPISAPISASSPDSTTSLMSRLWSIAKTMARFTLSAAEPRLDLEGLSI